MESLNTNESSNSTGYSVRLKKIGEETAVPAVEETHAPASGEVLLAEDWFVDKPAESEVVATTETPVSTEEQPTVEVASEVVEQAPDPIVVAETVEENSGKVEEVRDKLGQIGKRSFGMQRDPEIIKRKTAESSTEDVSVEKPTVEKPVDDKKVAGVENDPYITEREIEINKLKKQGYSAHQLEKEIEMHKLKKEGISMFERLEKELIKGGFLKGEASKEMFEDLTENAITRDVLNGAEYIGVGADKTEYGGRGVPKTIKNRISSILDASDHRDAKLRRMLTTVPALGTVAGLVSTLAFGVTASPIYAPAIVGAIMAGTLVSAGLAVALPSIAYFFHKKRRLEEIQNATIIAGPGHGSRDMDGRIRVYNRGGLFGGFFN